MRINLIPSTLNYSQKLMNVTGLNISFVSGSTTVESGGSHPF